MHQMSASFKKAGNNHVEDNIDSYLQAPKANGGGPSGDYQGGSVDESDIMVESIGHTKSINDRKAEFA